MDRYVIVETDSFRFVVKDRMTGEIKSREFARYLDAWNFIRSNL